ncbi:unnamed protein product, partial [Mesorhabditis spiculigera]
MNIAFYFLVESSANITGLLETSDSGGRRRKRKASVGSRGASASRFSGSGAPKSTVKVASRHYSGAGGGRTNFYMSSGSQPMPSSYSYRTTGGSIIYLGSASHSRAHIVKGSQFPTSHQIIISIIVDDLNYPLQLTISFDARVIERNAKVNGTWGEPEKKGTMPIDNWRIFSLTVLNVNSTFEIYFNNEHFAPFTHRTAKLPTRIRIEGDVEVHSAALTPYKS